ncbi:MAG: hypothetical protein RMJ38_04085 [candidate division WOR-3 bacterium]|nr:hypothetical protein [candidate division WOR-3 bacterium]MDW8150601.1 hypothetical protein [candidate division WOR-3 bacterium]
MLILINLSPEEAFNRANTLVSENKSDSVGYYLSIAYKKYPYEVENVIYLKYLQDSIIGGKIAVEFLKYNKTSQKISTIALNEMIRSKNYLSIPELLEFHSDTTTIGKISKFYSFLLSNNYEDAIKVGDEILDNFINQRHFKLLFDEDEPLNKLINNFHADFVEFSCSHFFMESCIKHVNFLSENAARNKALNLIIYYGYFRLISDSKNFNESISNLEKFAKVLILNECKDYNKLTTIFSSVYFETEASYEYEKFLSILDTLSKYCGNFLDKKIKVLKAFALRGLDRNKEAIDILISLKDSLIEPHRRYLVLSLVDYGNMELAKKLYNEFKLNDVSIIKIRHCETLYSQGKYKEVLKECDEMDAERAYVYFMQSKNNLAKEIIDNLLNDIENSNKNYTYYWNKGWFMLLLGKIDSSYYYTKMALDMKPNNSFLIMNLGSIYLSNSQIDSAIYYYKKAYETNKKYGNYYEKLFFNTLKNDIELIANIYKIPKSKIRELRNNLKSLNIQ